MAQLDDLYAALKNADAAGDTAGAQKLAAYIKAMPTADPKAAQATADRATYSPVEKGDGTFIGNLKADATNAVAGYGSSVPRLARGVGQRYGEAVDAVSTPVVKLSSLITGKTEPKASEQMGLGQANVDEANKLDAPLLATKAGSWGNVAGNVAAGVPTAFIPGANTLMGSAVIGGALGAAQPTSTGESPIKNALVGAVAGPAGVVAGRTLAAGVAGAKALIEPFYEAGRQRIAGRVIQRFAEDPSKIAAATSTPTITGAVPTLAEQTGDRGLAQLQDSLRSTDPQIANQITNRLASNNAARVDTLRGLAGQDGARDFAAAERAGTAEQLYGSAFKNESAVTPSQLKAQADLLGGDKIGKLLQTPAIADAKEAAKTIAANKGVPMDDPAGSVEGLHYMKLAMDDAIAAAKAKGSAAGENLAQSIKQAQGRLVSALETLSPDYKAARVTYAQMSKPVNSMDVANDLLQRGTSKGADLTGTPTINRNALLGALQDEPALIARATGRKGVANGLADVMSPEDLTKLRAVASEADRAGAVATAGNGPGSATAQRMASQNILSQVVGPTGLPKSWAESVLANTIVGKPFNLLYGGVAEPRIQKALAEAVLDPAKAQAMLEAAKPAERSAILNLLARTSAARTVPTSEIAAKRLQQ